MLTNRILYFMVSILISSYETKIFDYAENVTSSSKTEISETYIEWIKSQKVEMHENIGKNSADESSKYIPDELSMRKTSDLLHRYKQAEFASMGKNSNEEYMEILLKNPKKYTASSPFTNKFNSSVTINDTNSALGPVKSAMIAILTAIFSCLTIGGNLLVITAFFLERCLRMPTNYFIASLAVTDVMIGVFSMNLYSLYVILGYWPLGRLLCDLWLGLDYTACLTSQYTVFFITLDRYFSVKIPAKYRNWRTENKIITMVAVTWIVPSFVFFITILGWPYFSSNNHVRNVYLCYAEFSKDPLFNTILTVAYFWVTLAVMTSLYIGIYHVALNLQKRSEEKRANVRNLISNNVPAIHSLSTSVNKDSETKSAHGDSFPPNEHDSQDLATNESGDVKLNIREGNLQNPENLSEVQRTLEIFSKLRENMVNNYDNELKTNMINKIDTSNHISQTYNAQTNEKSIHKNVCEINRGKQHENLEQSSIACDNSILSFFVDSDIENSSTESSQNHIRPSPISLLGKRYLRISSPSVFYADTFPTTGKSAQQCAFPYSPELNIASDISSTSNDSKLSGDFEISRSYFFKPSNRYECKHDKNSKNVRPQVPSRFANAAQRDDVDLLICSSNLDNQISARECLNGDCICVNHVDCFGMQENSLNGRSKDTELEKSTVNNSGKTILTRSDTNPTDQDDYIYRNISKKDNNNLQFMCCFKKNTKSVKKMGEIFKLKQPNKSLSVQRGRTENRARKALKTITFILGAFVLCWTPYHILILIKGFCDDPETSYTCVNENLYSISYWLCYINSPINPFCYALSNAQFKKAFLRILRFDFRRL